MIEVKVLASGSGGNCYHVTDGSCPLLLECGIGFRDIQRGLGFKLSEVAACLVSHEHSDHSKALQDVLKTGIECYASQGTIEVLGATGHRLHAIRAKEQFNVGIWTILPFETQHDAAEPLGFLLANREGDKLLYATDTYYIRYRFQELMYIMVECNYSRDILNANVESGVVPMELKKRITWSHFSLENVKEFLKANDLSRVQEIWLLHMSDSNSDAERFKREVQEATGKMVFVG